MARKCRYYHRHILFVSLFSLLSHILALHWHQRWTIQLNFADISLLVVEKTSHPGADSFLRALFNFWDGLEPLVSHLHPHLLERKQWSFLLKITPQTTLFESTEEWERKSEGKIPREILNHNHKEVTFFVRWVNRVVNAPYLFAHLDDSPILNHHFIPSDSYAFLSHLHLTARYN